MEENYTPNDYVIFKRMSPHLIPGWSAKMAASAAAGLLAGALVFLLLGIPHHDVTRDAMWSEMEQQQQELTLGYYALKYQEGLAANEGDAEGTAAVERLRESYLGDADDAEIADLAARAAAAGISATDAPADIQGHVDTEVTVSERSLPALWRVLLSLLPPSMGILLFVDFNGATLAGEFAQRGRNRKACKNYVYRSRL